MVKIRIVILRLAFFAFVVCGSVTTISFVLERNRVNKNRPPPQPSSEEITTGLKEEPENKSYIPEEIEFPKDFFFGTASSDFQTTGGTGISDWNLYVDNCIKFQKKCRQADDPRPFVGPGIGTDFLNRYKEDLDLAEGITQVHRLSLEWARIEPEEGKFDIETVKKYKDIFLYMRKRGIEPMICLNHFALPNWFVEKGGWESSEAPVIYARYAKFLAQNIGVPLRIKWWLTFNEPQVMLLPYTKGMWPPDKPIKNLRDQEGVQRAMRVASNFIDSHRLAYRAIHKTMAGTTVMVSYASAPGPFYPHDSDSELDQMAYNFGTSLDTLAFDYAAGRIDRDFIGLNYYGRVKLKFHISLLGNILPWLTKEKPYAVEWEMPIQRKQGDRPKEFYPRALYDLIMKFKDLNLPIVITENGLSDNEDKFREEFIVLHLKAVNDAIRDGVPVIGYQYWALTDTWEWDGIFSQMGLMGIDRDGGTLNRTLRPSAKTYAEIIKTKKITKELLEKHKELLPK